MKLRTAGETSLHRHLADARQRLIQTGTRNRLVHTVRFAKRSKSIDIVDERSDDAFRILVRDGRRMRFGHDPSAPETASDDEPLLLGSSRTDLDEARYTDLTLQTRFGQDRLQKKLLGLAREARTLEEEQGINALYIAMGFLRWYEDEKSEILREAPLVLVPVGLRRNDRSSTYEVEVREDEIVTNEPLKRRLNDDFGIKLPEIPENEDWSPSSYFTEVAESVGGQRRWSIDRDGMQLGFFSFAKLLMVKDLEPEKWPTNSIIDHPIVAGLLLNGFATEPDIFQEPMRLDEIFPPADLIQVVDADASQTLVIETVRRGRNLVVQGPPGTGKSQTITNIIAAAAHDGKSVLFVAEKMAALNVVYDRLRKAGLQDVCLELHSRSANKRLVAEELGRTLGAAATSAGDAEADELTRLRDELNGVAEVMHQPIGASDVSAYRALSTLVRLNESGFVPSDLTIPNVDTWSRKRLSESLNAAAALAQMTRLAGAKSRHPFFGIHRTDLLPMDQQRLKPKLETLIATLQKAGRSATAASEALDVKAPQSATTANAASAAVAHIGSLPADSVPFAEELTKTGASENTAKLLADAGQQFASMQSRYAAVFSRAATIAHVDHLRTPLAAGRNFVRRLSPQYRKASKELGSLIKVPLPKSQPARLALLDDLISFQSATAKFEAHRQTGKDLLRHLWKAEATDFQALSEAAGWLAQLRRTAPGISYEACIGLRGRESQQNLRASAERISEDAIEAQMLMLEMVNMLAADVSTIFQNEHVDEIPFSVLEKRVHLWLENLDRLDEWSRLRSADEALRQVAGDEITDAIAQGALPPDQIQSTIRYVHAEALYRAFAAKHAWATRLTAAEKARLVGDFCERERTRWDAVARLIRGQHLAALPRGGMGAMGIVRAEIGKRRGHKPIRRLMTDAGSAVQEIKPILLMSPISVAQYLPPGVMAFDLLVIDEASQVRPEDAIGAIARARQIVVVGDKKQLPPTSFFERMISDAAEDEPDDESEIPAVQVTGATELESILTLCEARGLPSRMLRWHYRSRHPSLIQVSNDLFYSENGGLILFPSPAATTEVDGLTLRRVNGSYDRGGKRHNIIEADAIAKAVADHALRFSSRSLGVVTFSTAQRDMITERLATLRLKDEALDVFMREGKREEFFVKNIENVQGDERDVIFVSVGYGPRIAGGRLDSMAFGPVSTEGGERRLNVLFTRARYRTEVFASFDPADISLDRSRNAGARVLKQFLQFAETGIHHQPVVLEEDPDSDFEVAVAAEIRRLGYRVDHQVGSAGFKIDLAVRRPDDDGRYMLAIECDGANYHSAVWARERDRQRQEVLEGLGWRFHRVWSTDWFHRRDEEVRRLEAALFSAANARPQETLDVEEVPADEEIPEEEMDTPVANQEPSGLPEYTVASFPISSTAEPHELPVSTMAPIVSKIIDIEGPVHEDEIARRVATLFRKQKAGSRIASSVRTALRYLKRSDSSVIEEGDFWLKASQNADTPLRNRSRAPLSLRKASMLPPMEIASAARLVLQQNGALSWDELPRAIALLFGFQRTGPEFRPAVLPVIEALLHSGKLMEGPGGLQLANDAGGG